MNGRITIQDVAKHAGVSKVTVSYVLNGRDVDARISSDTRERVLSSAKTLGYRPNAVARMLATSRSHTIAVVFQYAKYFSQWSSFTSDVMHGVCSAVVEQDFDLMLHTRGAPTSDQEISMLTDGRADGALLLRDVNDPLVEGLIDRGFPAVLFFARSFHPDAAFVDADNYSGGRIAAQHLMELGHKRITMVRGSLQSGSSNDRFSGFRDALESMGLELAAKDQFIVTAPDDSFERFAERMQQPDRPTAVFVWSDDVAYKCMSIFRRLGLSIPDDISIIGFDALEQSKICTPQLTSIRQPITEMAHEAAQLLVALINQTPVKRKQQIFPLSIEFGASTAPPRETIQ